MQALRSSTTDGADRNYHSVRFDKPIHKRSFSTQKIEQMGNESIHLTETKYGLCDRITSEDLACSLIGKVIVCSEISPYNSR